MFRRFAPDSPDIRYHLAVALHRGGEARDARCLLDRLLADNNDFASRDEARRLREEIGDVTKPYAPTPARRRSEAPA